MSDTVFGHEALFVARRDAFHYSPMQSGRAFDDLARKGALQLIVEAAAPRVIVPVVSVRLPETVSVAPDSELVNVEAPPVTVRLP